jgi:VanZ family protein
MLQKLYKYNFWFGYACVLIASFLPIAGELNKIRVGKGIFEIRLDHLLHLSAYFLICMYYLIGKRMGLMLFKKKSFTKFILLIILLATVTEVVQLWVPARAFNFFDWVANMAGAVVGMALIAVTGDKENGIRGQEEGNR